ncbi:MAG: hypothetical protein IKN81_08565 [Oscillospiraceae bacterium]|nr:hypothetical protein [Oscillospiraceae bacterium]
MMKGVSPKYFNPDGNATRAQVTTMLVRYNTNAYVDVAYRSMSKNEEHSHQFRGCSSFLLPL